MKAAEKALIVLVIVSLFSFVPLQGMSSGA